MSDFPPARVIKKKFKEKFKPSINLSRGHAWPHRKIWAELVQSFSLLLDKKKQRDELSIHFVDCINGKQREINVWIAKEHRAYKNGIKLGSY